MSQPNRIRKVGRVAPVIEQPAQEQAVQVEDGYLLAPDAPIVPEHWIIGQLLNVRNHGDAYIITLYREEFDGERPERSLRFTNPADCQNFISNWYARQSHDPRAR